jgi:uncharacterized membrane protein HdeD (DUF308 family)
MSGTSLNPGELRELTWGWWLALLIGVVSIVAGIIVLAKPSNSLHALAVMVGVFILIDGIVELAASLSGLTQNRAVFAVICVIAGVLLIRQPVGGVKAVALVLGIWLIAAGVIRFVAATSAEEHRVWRMLAALVLTIFGVVIVSDTNVGYATLAVIAGLGFICYGASMIMLGWAMRAVRNEGPRTRQDASATSLG